MVVLPELLAIAGLLQGPEVRPFLLQRPDVRPLARNPHPPYAVAVSLQDIVIYSWELGHVTPYSVTTPYNVPTTDNVTPNLPIM